jgi:type II secretory pathway pseudopilin PulG
MKRRSITLIEFIISITLAGVLIAAIIPQFVMLTTLKAAVEDRVYVMREALLAMDQMSRILRWSTHTRTYPIFWPGPTGSGIINITSRIEGGHIVGMPTESGCWVMYGPSGIMEDGTTFPGSILMIYTRNGVAQYWFAENITFFDGDNTGNRLYNPATKLLTLRFTVTKNKAHAHVERVIKVLGATN